MTIDEAMQLASTLQSEGKLAEAEAVLKQILTIAPNHAYALHLLGIIAYQANQKSLGIQLIEQAIQHKPEVALFHSNLAEMYRQLKVLPLSIQHGENAVRLDADAATAWSNLGIAYYDAEQYEKAENCHQSALLIDPQLSCSLNNLGSIYKHYDQLPQAMAFYQAAIKAAPQFVEPINNLGTIFLQQQEFDQALHCFQQAITLHPDFADAHCNIGLAFFGLDQSEKALLHFAKALELKPQYAEAYYGLAKVQLHQHFFIEAEQSIRKAMAIKPQEIEFYLVLAEIFQEQGNAHQALNYLDQALLMDATRANAYLSKGNVLMTLMEISQAEANFLKVINDDKIENRVLAHYCLVQLRKIKPDHASFQELLSLTKHPTQSISPNKRAYLYFALGKCYDDMGEWATAFKYFVQGCREKRQRIVYDIVEQRTLTEKIISAFTKESLKHLQAAAHTSALPIFIVGMPRSGTTLIEQILSSHPQVNGAGELKYLYNLLQWPVKNQSTTLFYPENLWHLKPEIITAIAAKYIHYLRHFSPTATRIVDKMPYNFTAVGFIHAVFPHAKIIHVKRNPLDTCLSCYTKLFTDGQFYSYDLTELGQYYQCYERLMDHWRELLPEDAWIEVSYEAVVDNLEAEARRLIDYCDLPWDFACLDFHQSPRPVRTASFMQVRQPLYTSSVERWRRYEQGLTPLIEALGLNCPG